MVDERDMHRVALSCLLLGFVGPVPPGWLLDALADGLGGVVLFGSNMPDGTDVSALTRVLRAAAGRDIVIALDEEGGDVTRLDATHGSASPGAAALGHLDDVGVTESVYRRIGARCADAGITLDLAPVADVNVDALNPVIGVRAFSDDGDVAARHVAAAVRGLQGAGVAACLKHFPGHGATRADSHHEIATSTRSRAELDTVELAPFRAGIAAGARAVMTSHVRVPALDRTDLATISEPITTGLLRRDLAFTGAIVTDALEMRALADSVGMVEGFVRALQAGADTVETGALDYPSLVEQLPQAVVRAIDERRLSPDRVRDAARRTAALSRPWPGAQEMTGGADDGSTAARCLEVCGPLPVLTRPLVIECRPPGGMASGELPWSLGGPLAEIVPGTETVSVTDAVELDPDRDLVLVVRDPQRARWQLSMIAAAAAHPCAVIVDCGWPADLPDMALIRTRGVAPGLMHAAARTLAAGGRR